MKRLPVARSPHALILATVLVCCVPRAPRVRPTAIDSGREGDVGAADAACAEAAGTGAADADVTWADAAPRDAAPRDAAAADAAPADAHDDREPDFRLVLVDPPLSVVRGETAPLRVRIDRIGGFDAPVLIDLWGLPDTVWAQARESRVGDDVIDVTIEASEDSALVEETPFAVQASALGIRRVARTTISVR